MHASCGTQLSNHRNYASDSIDLILRYQNFHGANVAAAAFLDIKIYVLLQALPDGLSLRSRFYVVFWEAALLCGDKWGLPKGNCAGVWYQNYIVALLHFLWFQSIVRNLCRA